MKQMMDAIVKPTAGPGLELRQVPVPVPGPGEVLIKIHKTAICGSDVHIYKWNQWAQQHVKPPQVIGHEYVGEIAELEDVVSFFDAFGNATHTALMFPLIGEDVLITGAGPIGIIAGGICKYAGARRVVITDVNEYRLALARKMGVDAAVNTAKEDLHAVMRAQGLTEGFDVGLEMSGNAAAFHQLISVMRSGGKVSLLGLGDGPISVDMNQIITNGLTLQGIYGRKMDNWHQMSYMVQGGLDLTPVITHRFHYTDFQKGFDAMMSGKSGKVVLDWTK